MGETRKVTRRTLLGGAAAVGAASLVRPGGAFGVAASARPPLGLAAPTGPSVSSLWIGSLSGRSGAIRAPRRFVLAGVEWGGPAHAHVELRARAPSGRWSPWVPASTLGHAGDGGAAGGAHFGEPVWTGEAERIELRTNRPLHDVRAHFVSIALPAARAAGALPMAKPVLDAGPGQPPIVARRGWAGTRARPRHGPTYGAIDVAFVHHTVNPNGYAAAQVPALLQSIFSYHVQVRGFWDIAYNFIIDLYGRIWEARAGGIDMPVIGAQAGAYNAQSTGVAILGDFTNVVPSQAAISALERLLAWKLSLHGVPTEGRATVIVDPASAFYTPFPPGAHVSLPRIAGHRDGDSTDCPGNALYGQLPQIRPRATALAGTPAQLTITAPAVPVTPGTPVTLSGQLQLLDGQPMAGVPIELQQLRTRGITVNAVTIATLSSADDGSWSATVTPARNTLLRAVQRSRPAAVSDCALVSVAPVITLAVDSTAPLRVAGTVSPAKRRVTVALYRAGRTSGKPLRSRTAHVIRGRYSVTLRTPAPGNYVLVARTAADPLNAAGASPPVAVTIA